MPFKGLQLALQHCEFAVHDTPGMPQHVPILHRLLPVEHGPPCAQHMLPEQHARPAHVLPAQHGWLGAPQLEPHTPLLQVVPVVGQPPPLGWQVPPSQQPEFEQTFPPQQGWPGLPQAPVEHEPPAHVAPLLHATPGETQVFFAGSQQPLFMHSDPNEQHTSPAAPQVDEQEPPVQVAPELQRAPGETHTLPTSQQPPLLLQPPLTQHWRPEVPHCMHWPPLHVPPDEHVPPIETHVLLSQQPLWHPPPPQHGSPGWPHFATQTLFWQKALGSLHCSPPLVQQGPLVLPQVVVPWHEPLLHVAPLGHLLPLSMQPTCGSQH